MNQQNLIYYNIITDGNRISVKGYSSRRYVTPLIKIV